MTTIDTARIVAMFTRIAEAIESEKDRLCALDGVIGDADHGIAMSEGFLAVRTALEALDASTADPTAAFNTAAKSFLNAVGASSGPLYATAFMRAGAAVKGKETLTQADFVAAFQAMAKGIQDRGKAEPGEKTMVDAWAPAAEAAGAAQAAGKALPEVLSRMEEMSARYGLRCGNVFHAGDGNLHPLICYDANKPGELEKAEAFGADILLLCVEVGGVLTGEHGVGVEKRDLMPAMFSETDLAHQQRLKCAFDAQNLLNPGKVFPTLHRCAELGRMHVHAGKVAFPDLPRF